MGEESSSGSGGRRREQQLQAVLDHAPDAFVSMSPDGRITEWNAQAQRLFGWTREDAVGRTVADLIIPEDARRQHRTGLARYLRTGRSRILNRPIEVDARTKDGRMVPVELTIAAVDDGGRPSFNAFLRDIRERRAHERALREAEERFRRAFDEAPIGMALIAPDGRFLRVNAALCEILGIEGPALVVQRIHDLVLPEDADDGLPLAEVAADHRPSFQAERRFRHAAGHLVWVQVNISPITATPGVPAHFIAQIQDVTVRKGLEDRLEQLARHDHLTGLLNRRGFEEALGAHLAGARRFGRGGAVLVLDLDRFKAVNDSFGHQAGDEVLRRVSSALRDRLRETDVPGRLGGDEFAVVLPGTDAAGAATVVAALQQAIDAQARPPACREHRVAASIGAVLYDGSATVPEVLAAADAQMYATKRRRAARRVDEPPSSPSVRTPESP